MKKLLPVLIILICFAVMIIAVMNTYTEYAAIIKIETPAQYDAIIKAEPPDINFESLRDTPFGDNITILRVRYRVVNGSKSVSNWLGSLGIRDYPELVQ